MSGDGEVAAKEVCGRAWQSVVPTGGGINGQRPMGGQKRLRGGGAGRDLVWNPVPGKEKKQEKTEIEWYGWIFVLTSYYH